MSSAMSSALAFDDADTDYSDARDLSSATNSESEAEDATSGGDVELEHGRSLAIHDLLLPIKVIKNKDFKFTLKTVIPILLEGKQGQYIAVHEDTRICGEGADLPSALRDFQDAFITVYFSYKESKDPLSHGAKKYFQFLTQLVADIETV